VLSRLFFAGLLACTLLASSRSVVASDQVAVPSSLIFLSPSLSAAQQYTWEFVHTREGQIIRAKIACTVQQESATGYRLQPELTVGKSAPEKRPLYDYKNGVAFGAGDEALRHTAVCPFYYTADFGVPPDNVSVGTTWQYDTPASYQSDLIANAHVTATITSLDPITKEAKIHVVFSGSGPFTDPENTGHPVTQNGKGTVDLDIINGGVIKERLFKVHDNVGLAGTTMDEDITVHITFTGVSEVNNQ
jgi:hypothetical protein